MKRIILPLLIIIAVIGVGAYVYSQPSKQTSSPVASLEPAAFTTPTPQPEVSATPTNTDNYCLPENLTAHIELDPGAGNIYGTLTLKNTSNRNCQIIANNFLTVDYDKETIQNISVVHVGQPEASIFTLMPNQIVYSQIHYPNGPQCGANPKSAKVSFSYSISPTDGISFLDDNDNSQQGITVCSAANEITQIQVWNLSTQPITP